VSCTTIAEGGKTEEDNQLSGHRPRVGGGGVNAFTVSAGFLGDQSLHFTETAIRRCLDGEAISVLSAVDLPACARQREM
jgi:hypothetical protein